MANTSYRRYKVKNIFIILEAKSDRQYLNGLIGCFLTAFRYLSDFTFSKGNRSIRTALEQPGISVFVSSPEGILSILSDGDVLFSGYPFRLFFLERGFLKTAIFLETVFQTCQKRKSLLDRVAIWSNFCVLEYPFDQSYLELAIIGSALRREKFWSRVKEVIPWAHPCDSLGQVSPGGFFPFVRWRSCIGDCSSQLTSVGLTLVALMLLVMPTSYPCLFVSYENTCLYFMKRQCSAASS